MTSQSYLKIFLISPNFLLVSSFLIFLRILFNFFDIVYFSVIFIIFQKFIYLFIKIYNFNFLGIYFKHHDRLDVHFIRLSDFIIWTTSFAHFYPPDAVLLADGFLPRPRAVKLCLRERGACRHGRRKKKSKKNIYIYFFWFLFLFFFSSLRGREKNFN
jgi:hypothetical protein